MADRNGNHSWLAAFDHSLSGHMLDMFQCGCNQEEMHSGW